MKKILFAAIGIFSLSACGGGNSAPPNSNTGTNNSSVTGVWDGTLTGSSGALTTYMEITQVNTPNSGDITGKFKFPQVDQNQVAAVTGNALTGNLIIADLSGSIKCQGSFSGITRYEGSCLLSANSATGNAKFVMQKR
jgi:hypothetical protein